MNNKMKCIASILSVLLCLTVLAMSAFSVSAEKGWSADLVIEQGTHLDDDGSISVSASIRNITAKEGIICVIFHIHYDSSKLELLSWKNGTPNGWDFSGPAAEDWTKIMQKDGDTYLMFTQLNPALNAGITQDDAFKTELKFKPLTDDKSIDLVITNISFSDITIVDTFELPDRTYSLQIPAKGEEISVPPTPENPTTSVSAPSQNDSSEEGAVGSENSAETPADPDTTWKIVIIAVAIVAILAASVCTVLVVRKKKKS